MERRSRPYNYKERFHPRGSLDRMRQSHSSAHRRPSPNRRDSSRFMRHGQRRSRSIEKIPSRHGPKMRSPPRRRPSPSPSNKRNMRSSVSPRKQSRPRQSSKSPKRRSYSPHRLPNDDCRPTRELRYRSLSINKREPLSSKRGCSPGSPGPRKKDRMSLSPPRRHGETVPFNSENISKSTDSLYRDNMRREDRNSEALRTGTDGYHIKDNSAQDQRSGYSFHKNENFSADNMDKRQRAQRSRSPYRAENRFGTSGMLPESMSSGYNREPEAVGKRIDQGSLNDYSLPSEGRPLLGERFCEQETVGGEMGRIYTHEELKKITVDIRRNIPVDNMSHIGRGINPVNVVVVRRQGEGNRPIFDRDEIRQAHAAINNTNRVEGEFAERRIVAIVKDPVRNNSPQERNVSSKQSGADFRENFQIRRDQFQSDELSRERMTLNEKWSNYSDRPTQQRNLGPSGRSSVERNMGPSYSGGDVKEYSRRSNSSPERISYPNSRNLSVDRYERDQYHLPDSDKQYYQQQQQQPRSSIDSGSYGRFDREQAQYNKRPSDDPHDLRHSLASKRRQGDSGDDRHQFYERRNERNDSWPENKDFTRRRFRMEERQAPDTTTGTPFFRDEMRESGGLHKEGFFPDLKDKNNKDGAGLPNFASRPDKYRYQEWVDKPDMVPKGPSYYEHDNRGEGTFDTRWLRGRGRGGFGMRGRGRGRGGAGGGHAPFRGRGGAIRSRGGTNNRRKPSPSQWEHDMFEKASPDRKSEQDNKPSSTTEGK